MADAHLRVYLAQCRGPRRIPLENANGFMGSSASAVSGPAKGSRWQAALLERPRRSDHIALVYKDDAFLVESVGRFIDSGLRSGDGIVVLCTLPRWEEIRQRLASRGADLMISALRRGQLIRTGVHNILLNWMGSNCSQSEFNEAVGGLVDMQLGQYPAVRVFSELADVLLDKDNWLIATNAQRGWNSYLRGKPVSVLSAWRLDRLYAEGYGSRLERLYLTHQHILTDDDGQGPGSRASADEAAASSIPKRP